MRTAIGWETIQLGLKNLRLHKLRSFLTALGIIFGVGAVICMLSISEGASASEMELIRMLGTQNIIIKSVKPDRGGSVSQGNTRILEYGITHDDLRNISSGLARLSTLLLAAGAKALYPSIQGMPEITQEVEAVRWLDELLPRRSLSLTTVHAFSSCPMGERIERCAANSFGKVHRFDNLYVNDASLLPDSPGVNPQGSVMAFAHRNAVRFAEETRL